MASVLTNLKIPSESLSELPLYHLLNPRSIAFYGANNDGFIKMANFQFLSLMDNKFPGKVYPIHPKLDYIMGVKVYRSIKDVPEPVDLAVLILPKGLLFEVMEELGIVGIKYLIVVTAGFREINDQDDERRLRDLINRYHFHVIGPNCLGVLNTNIDTAILGQTEGVFSSLVLPYLRKSGDIAIASQSGTLASHITVLLKEWDLDLAYSISVGNEINIDICDCLEYFERDPRTRVIILYLEEIKRPALFLQLIRRIIPKKPILILYTGGTPAGAIGVASHTGALAGNDIIFNSMIKQFGLIRCYTIPDLLSTASIFSRLLCFNFPYKGRRVAIITDSGGPAILIADYAARIGVEIPQFSQELQIRLKQYLPATSNPTNPVDLTALMNHEIVRYQVPKIISESGEIDAIIQYGLYDVTAFEGHEFIQQFLSMPLMQKWIQAFRLQMQEIIQRIRQLVIETQVPQIIVNFRNPEDRNCELLQQQGIPTFRDPTDSVQALQHYFEYKAFIYHHH